MTKLGTGLIESARDALTMAGDGSNPARLTPFDAAGNIDSGETAAEGVPPLMDNNERLNIFEQSHQGFRDVVYQLADIAGIAHSNVSEIGYIISLLNSALIGSIVIEPGDDGIMSGWQKPYTAVKYNKKLDIMENTVRFMKVTQKLLSDDAMHYAISNEIRRKRYPVKTKDELGERYFEISNDLDRLRRDMEPIASALKSIAKTARKKTHKGREPEWNKYRIVWEAAEFFDDASCHKPSPAKTSPFTAFVEQIFTFAFKTKKHPDVSRIIRAALRERPLR